MSQDPAGQHYTVAAFKDDIKVLARMVVEMGAPAARSPRRCGR